MCNGVSAAAEADREPTTGDLHASYLDTKDAEQLGDVGRHGVEQRDLG